MERKLHSLYSLLSYLLLIVLVFCCSCSAQSSESCPYTYSSFSEGDRCGSIEVPIDYDNANGPKIKLSYLVMRSKSENRKPDPVVFIQGGPGGSSLSEADLFLRLSLDPDRDFILYDQRGTGFSDEIKNDLGDGFMNIMAKDFTAEEEQKALEKLVVDCKANYQKANIPFSAYNTEANAVDLEALRKHLGYEKWNLYAGSYGTRLAMIYMDRYPEASRSAVLMGLFPPQIRMYEHLLSNFDRALEKVFSSCEEDPYCQERYPHLKEDFLKAYQSLEEKPFRFEWRRKNFTLNTQDFLLQIHQMLYSPFTVGNIPSYIKAVEARNSAAMAGPTSQIYRRMQFVNFGVYWSVMAADEGAFNNAELVQKDIALHSEYSSGMGLFFSDPYIIKDWQENDVKNTNLKMEKSDIPTLLINGGYDPITPPSNAYKAAESFSKSQIAIFTEEGHAVYNPCFFQVTKSFLNAPEEALDLSCVRNAKNTVNWR